MIDSLRALNSNCLLVDGGDFSGRAKRPNLLRDLFIFKMMLRLGYDAMTFGERELGHGHGHFTSLDPNTTPIVMSNVTRSLGGESVPAAERYVTKEVAGIRFGIFALLDPAMSIDVGDSVPDYVFHDPIETTATILAEFEKLDIDISVLLMELDRVTSESVLERFPEIDVAVTNRFRPLPFWESNPYSTILVKPGRWGRGITQTILEVDRAGQIVDCQSDHLTLGPDVEQDPQILRLITVLKHDIERDPYNLRRAQQLKWEAQFRMDRYIGVGMCLRCHQPQYETWLSGPHANAFQSLVNLGMDTAPECLGCHTVGYGQPTGFMHPWVFPILSSVQCESCHAIGTDHTMRRPETEKVGKATCVRCHNEEYSPDFDYAGSMERIRHWD